MLIFPSIILAQFEQKLSINLSAGPFKTIGSKDYVPYEDYPNEYWPYQMSNFKTGITGDLGFQFNLNRHLSLCIEVGLMYSGGWYYSLADDGTNWLDWTLYQYDTTDVVLETGSNEMTFFNLSFGLASKYYILPNRKINPYIFAGIMLNFTTVNYTNNYWQARKDHDMLAPDDTYPTNDFLEENTGIGFNPGLGAEYNLNDKIGFFISAGYYFIFLKEENFKLEEQRQNKENFHSINFNAGIRFSFLKSKNL
jgi:opacity protein-like surface antigen